MGYTEWEPINLISEMFSNIVCKQSLFGWYHFLFRIPYVEC